MLGFCSFLSAIFISINVGAAVEHGFSLRLHLFTPFYIIFDDFELIFMGLTCGFNSRTFCSDIMRLFNLFIEITHV